MPIRADLIPALNGLRALAAYVVVISHFSSKSHFLDYPFWQSGRLGVMIFFMLSGFLMGHLYIETPLSAGSLGKFFSRRLARVVPLYLVLVISSFALVKWTGAEWPLYAVTETNIVQHLLFLSGVDVLWTIPLEIQFYITFPLLWLIFQRYGLSYLILITALLLSLIALLKFPGNLFGVIQYFLAGVLASRMSIKYSRIIEPLFVASVIIVFVSLPRVRESLGYANTAGWESLLHLSTIFLILVATRHSIIAKKLLGSSIGTFLGAISYSVYLLHLPLLKVLELIGFRSLLGAPLALITFLLLTTIASWISYRIIELPGQRLVGILMSRGTSKNWLLRRSAILTSLATVIIFAIFAPSLWKISTEECVFNQTNNYIGQPILSNVIQQGTDFHTTGLDPQIMINTPKLNANQMPCAKIVTISPKKDTIQIFLPHQDELKDRYSSNRVISHRIKEGSNETIIILPDYTSGRNVRFDPGNGNSLITITSISFGAVN